MTQEAFKKAVSIQEGQEATFKCDALKNFAINKGINMCHSCVRISPIPFPHINEVTYCAECLVKRMK